jgi:hypothetical protein
VNNPSGRSDRELQFHCKEVYTPPIPLVIPVGELWKFVADITALGDCVFDSPEDIKKVFGNGISSRTVKSRGMVIGYIPLVN